MSPLVRLIRPLVPPPLRLAAGFLLILFLAPAVIPLQGALPKGKDQNKVQSKGQSGGKASASLTRAEQLLEQGDPQAALEELRQAGKGKDEPRALLLRSTALLMLGDQEKGVAALDEALELDPTLRQGWLNRAALHIAAERYPEAQKALEKAQALDPSAEDNHLNLGAVLLLQGKLAPATEHFEAYLQQLPGSAEAAYLVATNFAVAGYVQLAVKNLRQAILLDERSRLRARTDSRFNGIADQAPYQRLLLEDPYEPPPGAYTARRAVPLGYGDDGSPLLGAVIDSLRAAGIPFDPRIEVTPNWAILWGELRVKVSGDSKSGLVEVSAPADRLSPDRWRQTTAELFEQLSERPGEQPSLRAQP